MKNSTSYRWICVCFGMSTIAILCTYVSKPQKALNSSPLGAYISNGNEAQYFPADYSTELLEQMREYEQNQKLATYQ